MKRAKPKQHIRKLKSGKKIIVNKGVKNKAKRSKTFPHYSYDRYDVVPRKPLSEREKALVKNVTGKDDKDVEPYMIENIINERINYYHDPAEEEKMKKFKEMIKKRAIEEDWDSKDIFGRPLKKNNERKS